MRELQNSVVAVVGTGGLGQAVAASLVAAGATVMTAGRSGTPDLILDVTDPQAGQRLAETSIVKFGRLDGVVIAAGLVAFGPLEATEEAVIEELLLVNALGPLLLARGVLPALRQSRGFLVNISGVVAATPMPGMAAYSASKAAAAAGFSALAREVRRDGILVLDAQPPHTETGLAGRAIAGTAPAFPSGLEPRRVADRIVSAIQAEMTQLLASDF